MNSFSFNTTSSVICETGAVKNLAAYASNLSISRVMLVTDAGLVAAGICDPVLDSLKQGGISVELFTDVVADPPEELVLKAAEIAKANNIDGVIGLGGGSSMDVAKLIAILTVSDQPLSEMYGIDNVKPNKVKGGRLPLIQIPTTAGTGSEVTAISIITTGGTTKAGVVSKPLLPDLAVLDAELTAGLPAHVTAATGIDAMVHAIEAFTTKHKKNVYSDMLAKQALELMSANIVEAVHNGSNLEARSNMLLGSMLAGQAFCNAPVAAVHALAYPIGGHYHIPHGLSNALVLTQVLKFNAPDAAHLYAELLPHIADGKTATDATVGCEAFIATIEDLIDKVELPKQLREVDVPEADLPMLASDAMLQTRLLVNNPRELTEADVLAIYKAAY